MNATKKGERVDQSHALLHPTGRCRSQWTRHRDTDKLDDAPGGPGMGAGQQPRTGRGQVQHRSSKRA